MTTYNIVFDVLQKEIDRLEKEESTELLQSRIIDLKCRYAFFEMFRSIEFALSGKEYK